LSKEKQQYLKTEQRKGWSHFILLSQKKYNTFQYNPIMETLGAWKLGNIFHTSRDSLGALLAPDRIWRQSGTLWRLLPLMLLKVICWNILSEWDTWMFSGAQ
jgi:hypothetical protein